MTGRSAPRLGEFVVAVVVLLYWQLQQVEGAHMGAEKVLKCSSSSFVRAPICKCDALCARFYTRIVVVVRLK
jgi:hypothetical protein